MGRVYRDHGAGLLVKIYGDYQAGNTSVHGCLMIEAALSKVLGKGKKTDDKDRKAPMVSDCTAATAT